MLIFLLRRRLTLKTWTLLWFIFFPLVHDYDVIQLIPLLETRRERAIALIASVPMWIVITFAYDVDPAWIVVGFIAPIVLGYNMSNLRGAEAV